ncbi:MAG: hypothetical protein KAR47_18805 [Planctomycetes bacterium]|nr:hypothetical protein [Planctomycetota bacterium]
MPHPKRITLGRYVDHVPNRAKGSRILAMEGRSLRPIFQGSPLHRNAPLFFEHSGSRAVRQGQWKLVAQKGGKWELYDMQKDRTELNNLSKEFPERVKEMSSLYDAWSKRCFVNKAKK